MRSFLLVFLFLVSSCERQTLDNKVVFYGAAMTMDYKIIIGEQLTAEKIREVKDGIQAVFNEIDTIYNKWNPNSELAALNRLPANQVQNISNQLELLLKQTQLIVELSEGRFDPTIEPLQQLWKRKGFENCVPSEDEIATLSPAVGWDKIHFANGLFYKDDARTQLDLGGIAKGFGVDLLLEKLRALKISNIYVEWGGEIRTLGNHPDQRPWNIYISSMGNPNSDVAIAHLSLHDQAIATSGDYLQNWVVNEQVYFHIFNPKEHSPLQSKKHTIASASVLAPNCALADGLATVAMMFSNLNEAQQWIQYIQQRISGTHFWLVTHEGEKLATKT